MKHIVVVISVFFFVQLQIMSQSCLPDGINFYSQADIDNFQTNYPNCTEIEGNVTIGNDGYLTDINSLNGLNVVTSIGGDLHIITNENLTSFSGLDALEYIGGKFTIEDNDAITDFTGFGSLVTIDGDFYIVENDNLSNFSGMNSLTNINGVFEIGHNLTLSAFTGLSALTSTGGLEMNYIHNMPDMDGLSGLTQVNGDLIINSCNGLLSFTGLTVLEEVSGSFNISDNAELASMSGLESLTTVGVDFNFGNNNKLASLVGLSSISSIGGNLQIAGFDILQNLNGLEALTSIGGELYISGNNQLTSIEGIANIEAQSITSLVVRYNPMLSECEVTSICDYLQIPGGDVTILSNASGCSSEAEVNASCATSIVDHVGEMQFYCYPNPADKEITIKLEEETKLQNVSIYNLLGENVLTKYSTGKTVDVSALSKGLYLIEITTSNGKSLNKIVIE